MIQTYWAIHMNIKTKRAHVVKLPDVLRSKLFSQVILLGSGFKAGKGFDHYLYIAFLSHGGFLFTSYLTFWWRHKTSSSPGKLFNWAAVSVFARTLCGVSDTNFTKHLKAWLTDLSQNIINSYILRLDRRNFARNSGLVRNLTYLSIEKYFRWRIRLFSIYLEPRSAMASSANSSIPGLETFSSISNKGQGQSKQHPAKSSGGSKKKTSGTQTGPHLHCCSRYK